MEKKLLRLINFIIVLFLLSNSSFGQKEIKRHQIGINYGEFVPLFRTQSTNYDLNYIFHFDSCWAARTSLIFNRVTGDDGRWDVGYRVGMQRVISDQGKFVIYTGIDFNHSFQRYDIDKRKNTSVGASGFLGVRYQIKPFISISTEPGFYAFHVINEDPSSFSTPKKSWNEYSLKNIGHLMLSFHF